MKQRLTSIAPAGAAIVAVVLLLASTPAVVAQDDGQAVYVEQKCNLCHSVAAADIEAKTKSDKMKGPDLSGYQTEDFAAVAAYARKEAELDGKSHKKEFKGSDEELQALVDWLLEQKASE